MFLAIAVPKGAVPGETLFCCRTQTQRQIQTDTDADADLDSNAGAIADPDPDADLGTQRGGSGESPLC